MLIRKIEICEVVCTQVDSLRRELTYNKFYSAYKMENGSYYLLNDLGYFASYDNRFFTPIQEWRDKQIERLIEWT